MVPVTAESVGLAQLAELRQQGAELQRLGRGLLVRVPEDGRGAARGPSSRPPWCRCARPRPPRRRGSPGSTSGCSTSSSTRRPRRRPARPGRPRPGTGSRRSWNGWTPWPPPVRELRGGPHGGAAAPPGRPAQGIDAGPEAGPRQDLGELLRETPGLARDVDARLGEGLLRVRDLLARLAGGRRPARADLESASRLLLEAQGSLQQAKGAAGRLASRMDAVAREGRGAAAGGGGRRGPRPGGGPRPGAQRDRAGAAPDPAAARDGHGRHEERLALAAGRLGVAGGEG
jgi:hypothetical protein